MCLSLSVFAYAENIEGPITTEPIVTQPTLEVLSSPTGAVAVGKIIKESKTHPGTLGDINYYRVSGATITSTNNSSLSAPGWFPNQSNYFDTATKDSIRHVIGSNDMEEISNTRQIPFSAICYIEIDFPLEDNVPATAFMISENVAITAGHCLYHDKLGGWATSVKVWPGRKSWLSTPYGSSLTLEIVVSSNWKDTCDSFSSTNTNPDVASGDENYDWGLLLLDEPLGEDCGYLGFSYIHTNLNNTSAQLSGYPNENPNDKNYAQYSAHGEIYSATSYTFSHNIDSLKGQSGSPIFYWDSSEQAYTVIGIHIKGKTSLAGYYNQGVRFTSTFFSFAWVYR